MKIVMKDNHGLDYYVETVIASGVNMFFGKIMVDAINKRMVDANSPDYYELVKDDYVLRNEPFEP